MDQTPKVLPVEAFEAWEDANNGLPPRVVAMHDLWQLLHRLVWNLCMNPSPRMVDKLIITHELTKPEYRLEPWDAIPALDRFLAEHPGDLTFINTIGAARAGFLSYAQVIQPRRAKAAPKPKPVKVGVNVQSVDRDLGF